MCKPSATCRECSNELPAGLRPMARFCSTPCKTRWNNRRHLRGAELYDAFMVVRFQRGPAKLLGMWSLLCRMASIWNEEDKEAGRQSYADPKEVHERSLRYLATRVARGR